MIFFLRMHDKLEPKSKLANAAFFKKVAKWRMRENLRSHPGGSIKNAKTKKKNFGHFSKKVVDGFLNQMPMKSSFRVFKTHTWQNLATLTKSTLFDGQQLRKQRSHQQENLGKVLLKTNEKDCTNKKVHQKEFCTCICRLL